MIELTTEARMSTVHIYKPSGKWYSSGVVDMTPFKDDLIHVALFKACEAAHANPTPEGWPLSSSPRDVLERPGDPGWMIVCVDPDHPYAHPLMLKRVPMDD
jgi:hypothetical protein